MIVDVLIDHLVSMVKIPQIYMESYLPEQFSVNPYRQPLVSTSRGKENDEYYRLAICNNMSGYQSSWTSKVL
jgi:hypothetical protein